MKIPAAKLDADIKRQLRPVYLVAGDEPLQKIEAVDAICAAARQQGFSERQVLNVEPGFDWSSVLGEAYALSLFADKKILDLRMPAGKPGTEGGKVLRDYAKRPVEDTVLIVQSGRLDAQASNSAWVKALDEAGAFVQIWDLKPRETFGWMEQRLRRAGYQPEPEAVRLLTERIEGNLLAGVQEVEKLTLQLDPGPLTLDEVRAAVADSARFDIFELADAALMGESARAARILHILQTEGIAEAQVSWVLARDIRLLAHLADCAARKMSADPVFKDARVWAARRDLLSRAMRRFPARVWALMLQRAGEVDALVKGRRKGNAWDELLDLTLWLSGHKLWPAEGLERRDIN